MPCLPAMRSEPKIGRCSHPSSPRAGSTTSTPSLSSPKPSRLSSTVTHKARSKTSCPGDSERRQPQVLRGSSKRLQVMKWLHRSDFALIGVHQERDLCEREERYSNRQNYSLPFETGTR